MAKPSEIKVNYKIQYYVFQVFGWGLFVFLLGFFNANEKGVTVKFIMFLISIFIINIGISHGYRYLINKFNWMTKPIGSLLIRIVISSLVFGVLFSVTIGIIGNALGQTNTSLLSSSAIILGTLIYFIWSILYVGYMLFYKARREEFKNMEMLALNTEIELKNLRSQLNPHFMFNAMNSIRALVDENPDQSKKAITQLSNVLRNALIHSKKNLITLKEELMIVDDYLSLEKIRYEERLQVVKQVDDESLSVLIPPLLLQTIVENAIKHGIAKLISGGVIEFDIKVIDGTLAITIFNTGELDVKKQSLTSIGVENTKKRLKLNYGDKAYFKLLQEGSRVKSMIIIPLNQEKDENNNN